VKIFALLLGLATLQGAQCPSTVFVDGNHEGGIKFRELVSKGTAIKLVSKKEDAAAVLKLDQREIDDFHVELAGQLTLPSGEVIWEKSVRRPRNWTGGPKAAASAMYKALQKDVCSAKSSQ
jgi:hypothetical protein